jgi:hypothetical protein
MLVSKITPAKPTDKASSANIGATAALCAIQGRANKAPINPTKQINTVIKNDRRMAIAASADPVARVITNKGATG